VTLDENGKGDALLKLILGAYFFKKHLLNPHR
jgi:hypothetical protein